MKLASHGGKRGPLVLNIGEDIGRVRRRANQHRPKRTVGLTLLRDVPRHELFHGQRRAWSFREILPGFHERE